EVAGDDGHGAAAPAAQPVEHPVVPSGTGPGHDGEEVHRPGMAACALAADLEAVTGEEPDAPPQSADGCHHRGAGVDRGLEGLLRVSGAPGVEAHRRRLRLPGHLVLPQDQGLAAGAGGPVDPPEVVADLVLPKTEEVGAEGAAHRAARTRPQTVTGRPD